MDKLFLISFKFASGKVLPGRIVLMDYIVLCLPSVLLDFRDDKIKPESKEGELEEIIVTKFCKAGIYNGEQVYTKELLIKITEEGNNKEVDFSHFN